MHLKAVSLRFGLFFSIALSSFAVLGAENAATSSPSSNAALESFQKESGYCDADQEAKIAKLLAPGSGPEQRRVGVVSEQVCRIKKLGERFEKAPADFCPGQLPAGVVLCYQRILGAMSARPGVDATGLVLLHAILIRHLVSHKQDFPPAQAKYWLMDGNIVLLEAIEHRTSMDKLIGKPESYSPSQRKTYDDIVKIENDVVAQLQTTMISKSEQMLQGLQADAGKTPASSHERAWVAERSARLKSLKLRMTRAH